MQTRDANPAGYTCLRQRTLEGCPRPAGESATWNLEDNPIAAFYAGDEKIGQAEKTIRQGERPPGTDKQPPYLLLYSFGAKYKGTFLVEMIDYSGELTRSEHLNADQKARLLERHLEKCDALFILSEAPRAGDKTDLIPEGLEQLMASFARLQSKKKNEGGIWNIPIALIINKWDRRSQTDATPQQRQQAMQQFLEGSPEPYHLKVRRQIEHSVSKDNVRTFVATHSVRHEWNRDSRSFLSHSSSYRRMGWKIPSSGPPSGVIRSTFRAIERHLKNARGGDAGSTRSAPILPGAGRPPLFAYRSNCRQKAPNERRCKEIVSGAALMGLSRSSLCVCLVILLLMLGETFLFDRPGYEQTMTTLNNPAPEKVQLTTAEMWLKNYATSLPFSHCLSDWLVLSKKKAAQELVKSQTRRENQLWARVEEKAPDCVAQSPAARDYFDEYPDNGVRSFEAHEIIVRSEEEKLWRPVTLAKGVERIRLAKIYLGERPKGRYVKEAQAMIGKGETERKQDEDETSLAKLSTSLEKAIAAGKDNAEAGRELLAEIDKLPKYPDAEEAEQRKRRKALRQRTSDYLVKLARSGRDEKNRDNTVYLSTMEAKFRGARTIAEFRGHEKDWESGLPHPNEATETLKLQRSQLDALRLRLKDALANREKFEQWLKKYTAALETKDLTEAGKLLHAAEAMPEAQKFRQESSARIWAILKQLGEEQRDEGKYRTAVEKLEKALVDPDIVAALDKPTQDKVKDTIKALKEVWGRDLYDKARKGRTIADIDRYLKSKADQHMEKVLQSYRKYLEDLDTVRLLRVDLSSIGWGSWWDKYINKVHLWIDNETIVEDDNIMATTAGTSINVGGTSIRRKPIARVCVIATIWNEVGFAPFKRRPGGRKEIECTLTELNGMVLTLEDWTYKGKTYPALAQP